MLKRLWLKRIAGALALATMAVSAGSVSAEAGKATIEIRPTSVVTDDIASVLVGLSLPEDERSTFGFDFTLPSGYKANSRIKIYLTGYSKTGPCRMELRPLSVYRGRVGEKAVEDETALVAADGRNWMEFEEPLALARKAFFVNPGEALPGQRRGDYIFVTMYRQAIDDGDTCGVASIWGIKVRYRTRREKGDPEGSAD